MITKNDARQEMSRWSYPSLTIYHIISEFSTPFNKIQLQQKNAIFHLIHLSHISL